MARILAHGCGLEAGEEGNEASAPSGRSTSCLSICDRDLNRTAQATWVAYLPTVAFVPFRAAAIGALQNVHNDQGLAGCLGRFPQLAHPCGVRA
jgi:hypothetical protein